MSALLVLALLATGLTAGGIAVARYDTTNNMLVSLVRDHDVNEAADRDDWTCECWWELLR